MREPEVEFGHDFLAAMFCCPDELARAPLPVKGGQLEGWKVWRPAARQAAQNKQDATSELSHGGCGECRSVCASDTKLAE